MTVRFTYRKVSLTRLRGHFPKGGYDVPHGQERWSQDEAFVH
jgi:hypothetical protein